MSDTVQDNSASMDTLEVREANSAILHGGQRGRTGVWVGLAIAMLVVLTVGGYLWFERSTRVETVDEFRNAMKSQGWESQDGNPGNFISRSSYELDNGFVSVIEYIDESAARAGQDKQSRASSATPGFKEETNGSVRTWGYVYPNDPGVSKEIVGRGALGVQFGKYRFESAGNRSDIDALVGTLGYLDPNKTHSDPIPQFRAAVKESRITTAADAGYAERSPSTLDGLTAECKRYHTSEDARAGYDTAVRSLRESKTDVQASQNGKVRTLRWEQEWPDASGKKIKQYVRREYNGAVMLAASGPVERRAEIDQLLEELGY